MTFTTRIKRFVHRQKAKSAALVDKAGDPVFVQPERQSLSVPQSVDLSERSGVSELWSKALDKLGKDDPEAKILFCKLIPKVQQRQAFLNVTPEVIDKLICLASQKQELCGQKEWKVNLHGKQISLRDLATKTIGHLNNFRGVAHFLEGADPKLGLPLLAIEFVLDIAIRDQEQMEALLIGVEKATYLTTRCSIYEQLCSSHSRADEKAKKNLENSLVSTYSTILSLIGTICHLFDKSTGTRFVLATWRRGEVQDLLKKSDILAERVDRDVLACNITCDLTFQDQFWERSNDIERKKVLRWISDVPFKSVHDRACENRTANTGSWLLLHDRYKRWRFSDSSMILWLHGIPGAGKTKLSSLVVEKLREELRENNHEALAYFYCDRNDPARRDPVSILRSLIRQLGATQNCDAIQPELLNLFRRKEAYTEDLTLNDCKDLVRRFVGLYVHTVIVIDALDECNQYSRHELIIFLEELLRQYSHSFKIFISSREDQDIQCCYQEGPNVNISAVDHHNRDDIGKFIEEGIQEIEKKWKVQKRNMPRELHDQIQQQLVDKSGGMFQWAKLQIQQLERSAPVESEIRWRLGKLPKDLDAAYREIYNEICEEEYTADIAKRAFQWLMCSYEPLKEAELVVAAFQEPYSVVPVGKDIDREYLLLICRNLITFDQQQKTFRFSHLSVQEFLEKHCWKQSQAHWLVSSVSLTILSNSIVTHRDFLQRSKSCFCERKFENNETDDSKIFNDLIVYIVEYWPTHMKRYQELQRRDKIDPILMSRLKEFIGPNSNGFCKWYRVFQRHHFYGCKYHNRIRNFEYISLDGSPLFTACILGFGNIVENWIMDTNQFHLDKHTNIGKSLLRLSVEENMKSVVDRLTQRAESNPVDFYFEHSDALRAAIFDKNKEMVRFLLDREVDISTKVGDCRTALVLANDFFQSREDVKLLLERGRKMNTPVPGRYGSSLLDSISSKDKEITRLLLDYGADVNVQLPKRYVYGNPLVTSILVDDKEAVELLLDYGADVNAHVSGIYTNALLAGIDCKDKDIVKLLLDRGAETNIPLPGTYGSLLIAAIAKMNDTETTKLFLGHGAYINAQVSGEYGSALIVGVLNGNKEVVRLLLDNGADVNAQAPGKYRTALSAIVSNRYTAKSTKVELIKLLLDRGVPVNVQLPGKYRTVLKIAKAVAVSEKNTCENDEIVQLLLSHGATDSPINESGNAKQLIFNPEKRTIVKSLTMWFWWLFHETFSFSIRNPFKTSGSWHNPVLR